MTARIIVFSVLLCDFFAVIAATIIFAYTGEDNFNEDGFITKLSIIQLLLTSLLAYRVFNIQGFDRTLSFFKHPSIVWLIISCGFLYLAADEYFMIHENLDWFIHRFFNIRETGLTDRIDDAIIGIYGLIGLGVLFYFRNEIKKYNEAHQFFKYGFILLLFTVSLDAFANRGDILLLFLDLSHVSMLRPWLSVLEESLKIFAEAFFVLAFYSIYKNARLAANTQESEFNPQL